MGRSRKIRTPPTEEISAVQRGRGEKIVSDKGRGGNFLFPPWGWYGCFLKLPNFIAFWVCNVHFS
jgi:hypothetical protein